MNTEIIRQVLAPDQILLFSDTEKKKFTDELAKLHARAFPGMPDDEREIYVRDYFVPGTADFQRQAMVFRNEAGRLIGANICTLGKIFHGKKSMRGVYLISSAVDPEYQNHGIGKSIGIRLLTELQPDVLFTTASQSSALHSRVGLVQKGIITDYEVYPRLEQIDGTEVLAGLPYDYLGFAVSVFRQVYAGVVEGCQEKVDEAIRNLTVVMVRKNLHGEMYDFSPWEKNGREDRLAKALGLSEKDGALIMFIKKGILQNVCPSLF